MLETDGMLEFEGAIKNKTTLTLYRHYLAKFLNISSLKSSRQLLKLGKSNPTQLSKIITGVILGLQRPETIPKRQRAKYLDQNGKPYSNASVLNVWKALKKFLFMNDVLLNWDKLQQYLPSQERAEDRAITKEEITELLKVATLQEKCIVMVMVSSGCRVGALPHIRMRDIHSMADLAKVVIYPNTDEEYYTFITPETYKMLQSHLHYREKAGEELKPNTPIFTLQYDSIRNALRRLIRKTTINREKSGKRYEFSISHSFRKYFKTECEKYMKSLHVEVLLGHKLGVTDAYFKPTDKELLAEYEKALSALTFFEAVPRTDNLKAEFFYKTSLNIWDAITETMEAQNVKSAHFDYDKARQKLKEKLKLSLKELEDAGIQTADLKDEEKEEK